MIDVLFFGRIADLARQRNTSVDPARTGETLFALRDFFFAEAVQDGRITTTDIRMSVNQSIAHADQRLHDGDEVAFFSVFSGG